jgi:hypothetical protein
MAEALDKAGELAIFFSVSFHHNFFSFGRTYQDPRATVASTAMAAVVCG